MLANSVGICERETESGQDSVTERRPVRNRRRPGWMTSGDYVMISQIDVLTEVDRLITEILEALV